MALRLHKGLRPGLRRDVGLALALKCILLLALYVLCFGPAHRFPADARATAAALVGTTPAATHLPEESR